MNTDQQNTGTIVRNIHVHVVISFKCGINAIIGQIAINVEFFFNYKSSLNYVYNRLQ